jgi:hypothetical protein
MALTEHEIDALARKYVHQWLAERLLDVVAEQLGDYAERQVDLHGHSDLGASARIGDEGEVELTVHNRGALPMRDVRLRVAAARHARVGLSGEALASQILLPPIDTIAPRQRQTVRFRLKIIDVADDPGAAPHRREVLRARITEWTPDLAPLARWGPSVDLLPLEV